MANTTNFGWETPDDTDLVKDGALAMRTLGNAIDTSLVDLKGGTTGQVLSKNTNTDMDFTWVTPNDADAIQNSIVDAKGDLIAASANDTPARLAVGNNGDTLVADSSTSTGLRWQGNYSAGKNYVLNSDFRISQRGATFSNPSSGSYLLDRFLISYNGTGATRTVTQEAQTPNAIPGYDSPFFFRLNQSVAGTGGTFQAITHRIEDARSLAAQTATFSFWAKANANQTFNFNMNRNYGSGGSATDFNIIGSTLNFSVTTSWQRFTATVSIPNLSGKTIGAGSYLEFSIFTPVNSTFTLDLWGIQLEAGNTATAFQTATGTLAGELAACQRYFARLINGADQTAEVGGISTAYSQSQTVGFLQYPVYMRTAPTITVSGVGDFNLRNSGFAGYVSNAMAGAEISLRRTRLNMGIGSNQFTAGQAIYWSSNTSTAFIDASAEL